MSASILSKIPFFADLPDQLLWHLGRAAEPAEYAREDRLFRANDPRSAIWVIL